jgi:hypothetical protein
MKRIILVGTVALVMAAMMVATVLPAFAAPNPNSAAGRCEPPGQSISNPELPSSGPPGQKVKQNCAPGHQP